MERLERMSAEGLDGRVAVVTGGGSGIGAASTRRLRARGAVVVVVDKMVGSRTAMHDATLALACDITDAAAVDRVVDRVTADFGRCDVLINCAGVAPVGDAVTCSEAEWDYAFDVNAKGTWLVCRAFLPQMIAAGGGVIVNVASGAALRATPGMTAYSASKAAVVALTRSIALDYAENNIRANTLCPGAIDTPLHRKTTRLRQEGGYVGPAGAVPAIVGTPDEMAEYILLLAEPGSRSLTGSTLVADGGRVMH